MSERARNVAVFSVVLLLGASGAAYGYARYEMAERIRSFGPAIDAIGYARGGRIPSAQQLEVQAREEAARLELEVVALEVTRSEVDGLDATGDRVQQRLGGLGQVRMRLVRYELRGTLVARTWLLSRTGELALDKTFRQEVRLDTPDARPAPSLRLEQPVPPRGL